MTLISRRSGVSHQHLLPAWLRWILVSCLLLTSFQYLPAPENIALAAGTPCVDSGPSGGAFVARVCISSPADGATLSGDSTMTVTVTQVSGTMPKISNVSTYIGVAGTTSSSSLAVDFASPYTLQIPTERWVDGSYLLHATVKFDGGYITPRSSVTVRLQNGVSTAPHSNGSFTPKTSGSSPLSIVAVGDGGGGLPDANAVGNLAMNLNPSMFLYLGDVYQSGTYTEFHNYYEPTLGPLKSRTNPVIGNHETLNANQGYLDYWNMGNLYYSYNSGGWHIIALDSTSGKTVGSAQYNWLAQDLAANANTSCTLVYMHHPRFGLGGGQSSLQDLWALMTKNGVDVVLAAHEHNYQRWLPMNGSGELDPNGTAQYVIGTGGHTRTGIYTSDTRVAATRQTAGVLSMSLNSGGWSSRFITTGNVVVDDTSGNCHGGTDSTTPTPTPTATAAPSPTATATPSGASSVFLPVADARVEEARPSTNFGTSTVLRGEGGSDPDIDSYLRFSVTGLTGTPTSAKLRVFIPSTQYAGSIDGPALYTSSSNTWSETGITWSNKPARGTTLLGDLGAVSAGTWVEYNASPVVTGNGDYSFVVASNHIDATDISSREGANPPQLVITQSGTTSTATPSPTATATPSPTATVAASPTATAGPSVPTALTPVADAQVAAGQPDTNFGTTTSLGGDTSPQETSYLRFDVPTLSGSITSAKLRLWVVNGTTNAPGVATSTNTTWGETSITWNTRPAAGTAIADLGTASAGTWVEYDVTSAVTRSGAITFVLTPQISNGVDFGSRENTTGKPQLVITQSGTTSTATPSPTATATATATPSPTATATPSPTATAAPDPLALAPIADARVSSGQSTTNFGTATTVGVDQSPDEVSYLRFDVPTLSDSITSARLRLWVANGTTNGPGVATSPSSWSETGITWNTRPAAGTVIADLGTVGAGTWVEYDVTSAVTGSGPVSFALLPQSTNGADFNARESTSNRPQLVIEQSGTTISTTSTTTESQLAPAAVTSAIDTGEGALTPEATATVTNTASPTPTATATPITEPTGTPAPIPTETPVELLTGTVVNTGGQHLRCRADAALSSPVISQIPAGEVVTIRGPQEGDWLPVICDGQDGYVAAEYIAISSGDSDPVAPTPDATVPVIAEPTVAGTEPVVAEPTVDEVVSAQTPVPTEPVIEPTPLPIITGWQDDPDVPWWLATDSDLTTRWSGIATDAMDEVEIGFDLGTVTPLSHVQWMPTWPMQGRMEIQLSNDGVNWYHLTTVDLTQQFADQWDEIPVDAEARFVNLVFTQPAGAGEVGAITEIEFWRDQDGTVRPIDWLTLIVPTPVPVAPTEIPAPPTVAPEVVPPTEPIAEPTAPPAEPTQAAPAVVEPVPTEAVTPPEEPSPPPVDEGAADGA